jgi:hypothetical protein
MQGNECRVGGFDLIYRNGPITTTHPDHRYTVLLGTDIPSDCKVERRKDLTMPFSDAPAPVGKGSTGTAPTSNSESSSREKLPLLAGGPGEEKGALKRGKRGGSLERTTSTANGGHRRRNTSQWIIRNVLFRKASVVLIIYVQIG